MGSTTPLPIDGMKVTPFGWPHMAGIWAACLMWAVTEDAIVARFEADTGKKLPPPARNGLERMIDEATGVNRDIAVAFADWVTKEIWGESEC